MCDLRAPKEPEASVRRRRGWGGVGMDLAGRADLVEREVSVPHGPAHEQIGPMSQRVG
jgi:hypothetical protein